jgi:hypothetical protein
VPGGIVVCVASGPAPAIMSINFAHIRIDSTSSKFRSGGACRAAPVIELEWQRKQNCVMKSLPNVVYVSVLEGGQVAPVLKASGVPASLDGLAGGGASEPQPIDSTTNVVAGARTKQARIKRSAMGTGGRTRRSSLSGLSQPSASVNQGTSFR